MGGVARLGDQWVRDVQGSADTLTMALMDGRAIFAPLGWFPRLLDATLAQRARWELAGAGYGIHWPDLDEDVSTESLWRECRLFRCARRPEVGREFLMVSPNSTNSAIGPA